MLLKGRGRDTRPSNAVPPHLASLARSPSRPQAGQLGRAPLAKPEPDYEVVEYPSDQYQNAKLQPPPPPPPRPATGHPADAGASCGLCGGGGARVRCAECGRRALCASCDDMYHRHPKRRHHQRQALSPSQLIEVRPPLPPKATAPVPPPRRHKLAGDRSSASPRPPVTGLEQRRATIGHLNTLPHQPGNLLNSGQFPLNHGQANLNQGPMNHGQVPYNHAQMLLNHGQPTLQHMNQQTPAHLQNIVQPMPAHMQGKGHMGSMPYLAAAPVAQSPLHSTMGHGSSWVRPRGSLTGFNAPQNFGGVPTEPWESPESASGHASPSPWARPLRRGASVLDVSGCPGCGQCAASWRYGSCASLDHAWPGWQAPPCCAPHAPHHHQHHHGHPPHTPQPYRRVDSRAVSRAASRTGSRAASPAMSSRSRASRRNKHRTPSPPLPSSDADSESESDSDRAPPKPLPTVPMEQRDEDSLGPAPSPPSASWQCEHCTFVNEPGVRVCAVCCRTPVAAPKIVAGQGISGDMGRLRVDEKRSPSQTRVISTPVKQNGGNIKSRSTRELTSTGCGPSPPRESQVQKSVNRLITPNRDQNEARHDMGIGPSPPRERFSSMAAGPSPPRETIRRPSPYRERSPPHSERSRPNKHSVSVGPSPPRDSPGTARSNSFKQKMSTASPSRERALESSSSSSLRANVSTTGTSPPPQSISTQTYETATWDREQDRKSERDRELERERALQRDRELERDRELQRDRERAPSASRSRARRRLRDDTRRERSHSRHSLSSDTRESERSAATVGGVGHWQWRSPRDSPPEWSGSDRRLPRRASHLDLRRVAPRQPTYYHSQTASPEPALSGRALSLEALAGAGGRREAARGLELARLMADAERLGFSAAEVHAALAQNPLAPLSWLRERWPSLVAGVRAAAARLSPGALVAECDARAALARHRGALWPAVNECVERHRRQLESGAVSEEARHGGRVWGSPAGADDDAAPARAYDSSDEFEAIPSKYQDDDWMYLPLEPPPQSSYELEAVLDSLNQPPLNDTTKPEDATLTTLKAFLREVGVPSLEENLILNGLSSDSAMYQGLDSNARQPNKRHSLDFLQSESDFIDAYNALARSNPLHNDNYPSQNLKGRERSQTFNQSIQNRDAGLNSQAEANKVMYELDGISKHTNKVDHIERQKQQDQTRHTNDSVPTSDIHRETVQQVKTQSQMFSQQEVVPDNTSIDSHDVTSNKNHNSSSEMAGPSQQLSMPNTRFNTEKSRFEVTRSDEEKGNNLTDIVDNTQKLIQQMKEEINSDINSLGGQSLSHSEADNSSNESDYSTEHRSSSSETERETDDVSSDENETENKRSPKSGSVVNRTSSEDNEQFEEAMDHIEEQTENFRQTNIEILNSIARSLQEEHTISIELNQTTDLQVMEPMAEPEEVIVEAREIADHIEHIGPDIVPELENRVEAEILGEPVETKIEPIKPLASKSRRQDLNNNMFTKVSSFEEIYDELSTSITPIPPSPQATASTVQIIKKPIVVEKKELVISLFKPESPIKLIISEQKQPTLNAVLEETAPVNINSLGNVIEHLDSQSASPQDNTTIEKDPGINEDEQKASDSSRSSISPLKTTDYDGPIEETQDHHETNSGEERTQFENSTHSTPNLNEREDTNESETRNKSESPEKSAPTSPGGSNSNRFTSMIKSNIPKLIRILPNRQKGDKNSPKVIASKVPVRRGSLKQHAAPTPPKSHFGNVQNGHVKQLRTKLFNDRPAKPPTVKSLPAFDSKPSTSYSLKKRPAPQPPTKENQGEPTSSEPSSPKETKEKKNFFRETCRTEDEWTDSDSGDSQLNARKTSAEEPLRVPTPPPPVTVRRVSGQLIDLARVRLLEGSPERQARMLLAEGALESWEQAQLAVELVSRGAEPPAALLAALECIDLDSALTYLHQDCELCASRLPEHEMVSMLRCTHRCCRECARHYFTVQITERSIADCVCPYCKEPELEALPEDAWLEYFAHLDILLKTLLENDTHELFQRKLRDRTLALDPNFKWCVECSSGFFVSPKQKKLRCPECRSVSCATCRKPWSPNHEGLTCEQYTKWLEDNDPERSVAAVQQHLKENGLECPRCHFKYSLSRGGCMHFTCTQCKYEFCYGCGKPFTMGARCGLSEYCAKLGLHAHHPRNCLFYLRDKEPHELQTLLQMNNVPFESEPPAGAGAGGGGGKRCPVQLQRETPTGLVDTTCGGDVPDRHAGLCKNHYLEYLSRLVRSRALDPLPILGVDDLETVVRRAGLRLPPKPYGSLEGLYKRSMIEIVKEKIPLD